MRYTRRDFGKMALATVPAAGLAPVARLMGAAKPNSTFGGVQIGIITYSFRSLSGTAEDTLKYCLDCGISAVELMSNVAETYAGAPQGPAGGGPRQQSPEQRAARQKAADDLKKWRTSVVDLSSRMDK